MPRAPAHPHQMTGTCREEKTIGSDHATEAASRKAIKKGATKLKKAFLEKEEHIL
jgi:hypothetical protein